MWSMVNTTTFAICPETKRFKRDIWYIAELAYIAFVDRTACIATESLERVPKHSSASQHLAQVRPTRGHSGRSTHQTGWDPLLRPTML